MNRLQKWPNIDDSNGLVFFTFFGVFLVCKCILVIHCYFQNKNLSELLKKVCVRI
jgi:hypothetical protein